MDVGLRNNGSPRLQLLGPGVHPQDPFLKPLHLHPIFVPRSMLVRPPLTEDAVDGGGLSPNIAVTIDLADVDEGGANGADEPPNQAPSFAADTDTDTTLELAENTAGFNVGSPITGTDRDDGDTLSFTLSGTDASSFEISRATRQITTKAGVTYDYESRSAYSLAVDVSDGNG